MLSLICCPLLHGIFSMVFPADYTPLAKSVLAATIVINLVTTILHILLEAGRSAASPSYHSEFAKREN